MNRSSQIDILRGVGILLVVAGHNWGVLHDKDLLFRVIYVFHMPLFFFISGIFIKSDENLNSFLLNKFASILKPYIVVSTIVSLLYSIKRKDFDVDLVLGILYGNGSTLIWTWLWFLPCLFLSSALALVTIKLTRKNKICIFLLAFFLLSVATYVNQFTSSLELPTFSLSQDRIAQADGLPLNLDLVSISLAFMLFGFLTPKSFFHRQSPIAIIVIVALGLVWLHSTVKPSLDMNERLLSAPLPIFTASALSIFLLFEISKMLTRSRILSNIFSKVGKASLFIYLFHFPIQVVVTFKLLKTFPSMPTLAYVTGFFFGVFTPYILFALRNRFRFISLALLPRDRIHS